MHRSRVADESKAFVTGQEIVQFDRVVRVAVADRNEVAIRGESHGKDRLGDDERSMKPDLKRYLVSRQSPYKISSRPVLLPPD